MLIKYIYDLTLINKKFISIIFNILYPIPIFNIKILNSNYFFLRNTCIK